MANKEQKLFAEFPPVSTEQWESVIAVDLKGADYEKKLVWRTAEGFNVRPYYRAENLDGIKYLGSQCGEFPYVRGTGKDNNWRIVQTIEVGCPKEANAQATVLLTKGVESIGFVIGDKEFSAADLDTLLSGISVKNTELVFSGCATKKVAGLFIDKMDKEGVDPETVRASFVLDPIVKKLTLKGTMACKNGQCKGFENLASLISKGAAYKRIRFVNVSGEIFHNSGSTIVQELAFTLAAGHEYVVKLMEQGLSVDQVAPALRFSMAISSNYFMEIAKFRAARLLWANIMAPYNPSRGCASKMKVHAVTSKWNMTVYDPYVNMLRGTTEAMSAAVSGVHSIEVLPFDTPYEKPTDFSARIARNTQIYIQEETNITRAVDPWAGSYYVESLTDEIVHKAWDLIQEVEKLGGMAKAIETGIPKMRIEEAAARKQARIDSGNDTIVGINRYRLEKEDPIDILAVDNTAVREAQIKRLNELRANRDEAKVKAALAAITECVRTKKGNLLELAVEAAKVRASLGEISDACEEVVGRYKAVIRSISGVYSAEVKNDESFAKAKQMAEQFAKKEGRQPRIMIAKLGQDGHDRGAKVVATGYADIGFDVEMGPLFQTPAEAAKQAVENDVHVVGVSSLAAGHKTLVPQIVAELAKLGREDIVVIVGGVIPHQDYDDLYKAGAAAIFGPGTPISTAAIKILEILNAE